MKQVRLEYQVRFLTPAFLGNAEQDGQWRTPPFKALLRQWWRVVYAADQGFDVAVDRMREEEGRLFGRVYSAEPKQSQVRLRLSDWATRQHHTFDKPLNEQTYLGYGRVDKKHKAIDAKENECRKLLISVPNNEAPSIEQSMELISAYGTIGGRSRNGWGSLRIEACERSCPPIGLRKYQRPWEDALKVDWPHVLGASERGALIWKTSSCSSWEQAMKQLGKIRKELRGSFSKKDRIWLADAGNKRLPNSLRFKVRQDDGGKYGVIFHMPCLPIQKYEPDIGALRKIWAKAHKFLDEYSFMQRIAE